MEDNDNKVLTMASLFDGIGGFPLAAVRNGIREARQRMNGERGWLRRLRDGVITDHGAVE